MIGFRLIQDLAEQHRVTVRDLLGPSKEERLVFVRAKIAHALRRHGYSFPRIGRVMKRDHTSIVHLVHTRKPNGDRLRSHGNSGRRPQFHREAA